MPVPTGLIVLMAQASTPQAVVPPAVPATGSHAADEAAIPDIVVTAQKRAQGVQDVALSVAVVDGQQLRDRGITSAQQVAGAIAGVQVYSYLGSQPTFVIRGIGVQDFAPNIAPAAALYLDEVYLGSNIVSGFQVFDTARVEVLKGPQGDLFGRNTTGGAVSYTTNRPTDHPTGSAELTGGSYGTVGFDGVVSGPLAPGLSARFAAQVNHQGVGFYRNAWQPSDTVLPLSPAFFNPQRRIGASDSWAMRGLLQYQLGRATLLLNVHGGERHEDTTPLTPIGFTSRPGAARPCGATALGGNYDARYCGDAFGYSDTDGDPYRVDIDFSGRNDQRDLGTSLRAELPVGSATLVSITAWERARKATTVDTDGSPNLELDQLRDTHLDQWSQELRLVSASDRPFTWIAGGYASGERIRQRFFGAISPALGLTNFTDPALATRVADQLELNFRQNSFDAAAYGHAEYRFASTLTAVGGVRYTHEHKAFYSLSQWIYDDGRQPMRATVNFGATPADAALIDQGADFNSVSWKAGLNWKPSARLLGYASISRGYKSGGFDGDFAFTRAQLAPFRQERLTAYEIGIKSTLADRRLLLDGSAFFYQFDNPQVRVAQVDPATKLPFNQLRNLAAAQVYGGEVQATWRPLAGLDLDASAAVNHSRIDDPAQPVFNRNRLPLASPFSATGTARYGWRMDNGWRPAIEADVKYNSSFYLNPENTGYLKQHGYALVDVRASVALSPGLDIAAFCRNLTDHAYAVQAFALFGAYPVAYNSPRTFGVSLRRTW